MTELHQVEGDVFAVLPLLPADHFHGALIDPPFLWGFMNRAFDAQHRAQAGKTEAEKAVAWNLWWLRELHRVLVPGAYAAELAGFGVLPMLCGITGKAKPGEALAGRALSGPATLLARDFEGHHSRVRDQLMPAALLLKPLADGLARNAALWGVAGLNVAGCRSPASAGSAIPMTRRVGAGSRRPKLWRSRSESA